MQYLVTMEAIDPGQLVSHEQRAKFSKEVVAPGFEVVKRLKREGKILAGGLVVGARAITFITNVASNDELDQMLQSIPWWATTKTSIVPLKSWPPRLGRAAR
ncbi:MAG: hypothetical protein HYY31_00030 [Chloroflexi bacterium]|nr:hypothetical protein [Chloroflexota bacterium]